MADAIINDDDNDNHDDDNNNNDDDECLSNVNTCHNIQTVP